MEDTALKVLDLIKLELKEQNSLKLRCLAGRQGLLREIDTPDLNRPIAALLGHYENFAFGRIQLFGRGEVAFMERLDREGVHSAVRRLLAYKMPCCIFTRGIEPDAYFLATADENQCPVLVTELGTAEFSMRLSRVLAEFFSPRQSIHGVLVEVFGLGILLLGESGVGKSETALELIHRGHRLVADDVVDIHCVNGNMLMGMGANMIIGTTWKYAVWESSTSPICSG